MIRYLSEDEHLERMAHSIYLASFRRDAAFLRAWKTLPEDSREAFRGLARDAIIGADRIREAAFRAFRDTSGDEQAVA
jgi:hypothetical protein